MLLKLFREIAALYHTDHWTYINNFEQNSDYVIFNLALYVFATRI
jgi:hypothetical protein